MKNSRALFEDAANDVDVTSLQGHLRTIDQITATILVDEIGPVSDELAQSIQMLKIADDAINGEVSEAMDTS